MKIYKFFSNLFLLLFLSFSLIALSPSNVYAVTLPGEDLICGENGCPLISGSFNFDREGIVTFLIAISRFLTIVGVGLAVLFLVWSGILYITGNSEKAQKGILNAIIGLLIIILAYTFVTILLSFLQGTPIEF